MRVALIGDYPLNPNKISGGPQAVFTYLLEGLKHIKSLDLHVISRHKQFASDVRFQKENITFCFLSHSRLPFEFAYPILRRRVHHVLDQIQPDIVHAQSTDLFGVSCLGADYPTVSTVHALYGTEPRFGQNLIARARMKLHEWWARRVFMSKIRHIISISEYIHQGLTSCTSATFYPIDNPVADVFFELPSDQSTPERVLFVGLLRQRKRPDLALKALALACQEVSELSLQFAGAAIEPQLEARMHDFVAQHDLEGNVEFLGHLDEKQLLEAYRQMSFLLLTSELETSPMVIEQAMAAGKPVVATAVGGVPYLVENGRTGFLLDYNRPEQIARTLINLVQDHELRRTMGKAARQEALKRFKADIVAAKTYAVYKEVLQ